MTGSIPKHRNRYKVSEARQQMIDKIGSDRLEFELDDGYILELPHPMFYDAATKKALKDVEDGDYEAILRVLVGDKKADEFADHDGDFDDLGFVWLRATEDAQDVLAGRKRPTRS
jgi:hypothetical protein